MGIALYLDSTGGLACISGCAEKGHLIHTKLSFRPREVLWSESDFEYRKEAHYLYIDLMYLSTWRIDSLIKRLHM